MKLPVLIEQDKDGWFVAEAYTLRGCVSRDRTREKALRNVLEQAQGRTPSTEPIEFVLARRISIGPGQDYETITAAMRETVATEDSPVVMQLVSGTYREAVRGERKNIILAEG